MLPHYLAKVRSSSFGITGRKCKQKCNMHWFLNTHPILMHLAYLLTCCLNLQFLLNILCKQLRQFLSKQVLWTEAAFSECLACYRPDHHWPCNWQVAWTSSRMCEGKTHSLQAIIVTYSAMIKDVSVLSNVTRFLDCFYRTSVYWYRNSVCPSICLSVRP